MERQFYPGADARRRLKTRLLYAANAIWAVPAVLLMRLVRPLVHIRATVLLGYRIGHFVADTSIILSRRAAERPRRPTYDLFWIDKSCNEQWARMVSRRLFVRPWVRYVAGFNQLIPGGEKHRVRLPDWSDAVTEYEPLRLSNERFPFTAAEEEAARSWLRQRGWRDGERFVCLLARDAAYLRHEAPRTGRSADAFDYHSYRDTDIRDYELAVRQLLEKGYWVIRLGKVVHERLPVAHPKFIDYPFAEGRCDLLDIWLSARCSLFVSTSTGIDIIPVVYGTPPLVCVNALPLFGQLAFLGRLWVPKHLRWKDSGRRLTLREHCEHAYARSDDYKRAGILIEDLSPEEIASAVAEGESRLRGAWIETEDNECRQRRAWDIQTHMPGADKYHPYVHPEARLGSEWLRSMGDTFLE